MLFYHRLYRIYGQNNEEYNELDDETKKIMPKHKSLYLLEKSKDDYMNIRDNEEIETDDDKVE
ncbi:hypothetical protein [Thermoanaerobacterium sp. RBIITD]|uniref:hypothetical protein n=1 Tax=Thermoanaerobacterium sp. RBIITD TaxID=1550240 RepID=UPI000BB9970B|nr:hypothetical protein [Thermoanaerobacterium sp. RBIITD]SNX54332.1 hypothetical protein SAMN05660242_1989 [Thermoanaerobacterium sp. RBIITD]